MCVVYQRREGSFGLFVVVVVAVVAVSFKWHESAAATAALPSPSVRPSVTPHSRACVVVVAVGKQVDMLWALFIRGPLHTAHEGSD